MITAISQIIFILMIVGAIGALVFQLLKAALSCLLMGIVTVLILAVLYGVVQVFSWLAHLFA